MHRHDPNHSHAAEDSRGGLQHGSRNIKRLTITLCLVGGYMVAEVLGGIMANSLALLADAGHMLSDVAALGLSLFAIWFARRPPNPRRTYGYYRAEVLAALVNGATLVAVALYIFVEAYRRLGEPPGVRGGILTGIAVGGLLVNLAGLWILRGGSASSLNVRGAWLHVLTDTLGSVGAIIAGLLVWAFGWNWADPAVSVLIGLLVLYSSWALLRDSAAVLMEGTPRGIDVDDLRDAMQSVPGVAAVHDLHVWAITTGMNSLSAHVVTTGRFSGQQALLEELGRVVRDRFRIDHVTIQVEPEQLDEEGMHT